MELKDVRKEMNLRELGGYPVYGGKQIRHGVFWRCGSLSYFNEEETDFIRSLGIRSLFDFRSDYERGLSPDPEIPGAGVFNLSALTDRSGKEIDLSPEGMQKRAKRGKPQNFLEVMYGGLPFSPAYQVMFREIEAGNAPVLFHCTAGKDRTGIAAALIMLALGVNEETVLDDYEKTNEYRQAVIERFLENRADVLKDHPEFREQLVAYEGVLRSSARYSLDCILEEYGNYDVYFTDCFGLDEERRERLREMYTE